MTSSVMTALAAPRRRRHTLRWVTLVSGAVLVVLTYFPIVFVLSNSLKSGANISSNGVFALFTAVRRAQLRAGLVGHRHVAC